MRKKIVIIFNPAAGGRKISRLNSIVNKLRAAKISLELAETEFPGHASKIAELKARQGYDLIVAAGGDGTINEVINGVYPSKTPIAVIPLGTVNVLAREINLRNHIDEIVEYILHGQVQRCWLGCANGQLFSLMLSAGYDAKSVAWVSRSIKKYIGRFAYIISFMKAVLKQGDVHYRLNIDGENINASNVIVSNGKYYGGKYLCVPEGDIRDGELYAIIAQKSGKWNALKYAILMIMQKYPYDDSVNIIPVSKVTLECDAIDDPFQLDGDHCGALPVDISLSSDYINLLYPATSL